MLNQVLGALTAALSEGSEAAFNFFKPADFNKPEFRSALMAAVALEAAGANVDIEKLRSFLSANSLLSAFKDDLEKQLLAWVEKIAKAGGKAAAEGAIEALHLEKLALKALFALAHVIFFLCF